MLFIKGGSAFLKSFMALYLFSYNYETNEKNLSGVKIKRSAINKFSKKNNKLFILSAADQVLVFQPKYLYWTCFYFLLPEQIFSQCKMFKLLIDLTFFLRLPMPFRMLFVPFQYMRNIELYIPKCINAKT